MLNCGHPAQQPFGKRISLMDDSWGELWEGPQNVTINVATFPQESYSIIYSPLKIKFLKQHFHKIQNVLEKVESELVQKRLECVTKLEILNSLTIHFSFKSDKYLIIYSPLKIKFFSTKIQIFKEFLEIEQISKTLKMS